MRVLPLDHFPPVRLSLSGLNSQLDVLRMPALHALLDKCPVLVGIEVAPDIEYDENKQHRSIAQTIDVTRTRINVERRNFEIERRCDVERDFDSREDYRENEFGRDRGCVEDQTPSTGRTLLVSIDAVSEAVATDYYAAYSNDASGFESAIGRCGHCHIRLLLCAPLLLNRRPRSRDG